jgi:hypothetical protein
MGAQQVLREFSFAWDPLKVLSRLGSRGGLRNASPQFVRAYEEAVRGVPALLEPAAVWTVIPAGETNGHPVFDRAAEVALGVATIGPRLEAKCEREVRDGDLLRGLVLDALGSAAVAQVFREAERRIVADGLTRGLWPSRRFAPGYRGWPLEEQRFLFSKVDAAAVGVRINEFCMMVPRKSYSFRINHYAERSLTTRILPEPESPD